MALKPKQKTCSACGVLLNAFGGEDPGKCRACGGEWEAWRDAAKRMEAEARQYARDAAARFRPEDAPVEIGKISFARTVLFGVVGAVPYFFAIAAAAGKHPVAAWLLALAWLGVQTTVNVRLFTRGAW